MQKDQSKTLHKL